MNLFLRRGATFMNDHLSTVFRLIIMVMVLFAHSPVALHAQDIRSESKINKIDETNIEETLLNYLAKNKEYEALIQPLIRQNMLTISYECTEAQAAKRNTPHIYEMVEFSKRALKMDPLGHPKIGQWLDSFTITACDKEYVFNFLSVAIPEGEPNIFPLVNGDTQLDPIYQMQAEEKAKSVIEPYESELCRAGGLVLVSNTKFLGYIQENRTLGTENKNAGWFEEWTMWYCRDIKKVRIAVLQKENLLFEIHAQYAR